MIRLSNVLAVAGVFSLALASACSSSSSGGGSSFNAGLPASESLGSLSDSDAQKLCDAVRSFSSSNSSVSSQVCVFAGLVAAGVQASLNASASDADLRKACSDAESACQKQPARHVDAGAATCSKPDASCTATVGELQTCINDENAAFQNAASSLPTCGSLTRAQLLSEAGPVSTAPQASTPASCQTFAQKCPNGAAGIR